MRGGWSVGLAVCGLLLGSVTARAQERPVLFTDDFERGDLTRWDNDDRDREDPDIRVTSSPDQVHSGKYAVEITAPIGEGKGGKLPKWFMPGLDRVYAHWYCRFAADFDQGNFMHFVHVLGTKPGDKWGAFGKAGIRPSGTDFFTTGFEPWRDWGKRPPPGGMMFYTYYPDMKTAPDGRYWGNMFETKPLVQIERDKWYCMEVMVKLNTPGQSDGEQAAWVDGKPVCEVKGLRWRDVPELRLNCFWIMLYVHNSTHPNRVYFDDVVLSQEYIGPKE